MIDAEAVLAEAEKQCEAHGDSWISVVWEGAGDKHGYPWPDIRINLAIVPESDGMVYGMSLPRRLMDETAAKVRFDKADGAMRMTPPAPREDVVMAIGEALARFGQPSALSFE